MRKLHVCNSMISHLMKIPKACHLKKHFFSVNEEFCIFVLTRVSLTSMFQMSIEVQVWGFLLESAIKIIILDTVAGKIVMLCGLASITKGCESQGILCICVILISLIS